ncbi:DNA helicase RecQ [Jiulongibacter sediminis]|uniref:DNA helicase RecQ n=1 Tax=Jiulongibacter sediminis TaxID=1605367 RepID=A0A0P7C0R2_9BACT|nr:DNA helicase RecQ [Jiulongibacter sediminis]KPM48177.1 ATP-dependent DNA helicase RecQ [Jiulongibacter sediminis]TBX24343.1 ATP-dependent DNA helicase RecQ [Jiulongibacter sediminis]
MAHKSKLPLQLLKKHFGYDSFRPQQAEIINQALEGKDVLVLMPTGGGKSICYQIPALVFEGLTIVISPLIALMKDQVEALKANGIAAAYVNSSQSNTEQTEVIDRARKGDLKLLYIAPERLFAADAEHFLKSLNISLFAIDESHCISSWGHDFRPEYRKLGMLKEVFSEIPVMALTATADKVTRRDICRQLGIENAVEFVSSFDRPNIRLTVSPGRKKMQQITDFLKASPGQSGIIYCLSRKNTEKVAEDLRNKGFSAEYYHAGCTPDWRSKIQEKFINDDIQIIVATIAFGMGIDKSNVRWVIHYNLPGNVEGFYQEIGRAGRDGEPSHALLFFSYADIMQRKRFIDESGADEEQKGVLRAKLERMKQYAEAQICRRRILLSYFNEKVEKDCGNCDVCLNPPKLMDATVLAQKALSAVARTGESVALNTLIDILRGSRNQTILQKGYDRLPTFAVGNDLKYEEWADYIMQMLNAGVMDIAYDEGHSFKLNEQSIAILKGQQKLQLANYISYSERQEMMNQKSVNIATDELPVDENLFVQLKMLRKELAYEEGVPPYIIFNDRTLRAMASYRPETEGQMLQMSGVGEQKMQRYGADFLKKIRSYVEANDLKPVEISLTQQANKPKVDTYEATFELYEQGLGAESIAEQRALSLNTILGHLIKLKEDGKEIDLKRFVSRKTYEKVVEAAQGLSLKSTDPLKPLFEKLEGQVSYGEIKMALTIASSKE